MIELCPPALIYFFFVLTQIIIDIFQFHYQQAITKTIIMIIITFLLNTLCYKNMSIVAWIIVLIPFIFTTYLTFILIYFFGYNSITGKLNHDKTEITYSNNNSNGKSVSKHYNYNDLIHTH